MAQTPDLSVPVVVTITPTRIMSHRDASNHPYLAAVDACVKQDGQPDRVKTLVAYGEQFEVGRALLKKYRPIKVLVRDIGNALEILAFPDFKVDPAVQEMAKAANPRDTKAHKAITAFLARHQASLSELADDESDSCAYDENEAERIDQELCDALSTAYFFAKAIEKNPIIQVNDLAPAPASETITFSGNTLHLAGIPVYEGEVITAYKNDAYSFEAEDGSSISVQILAASGGR